MMFNRLPSPDRAVQPNRAVKKPRPNPLVPLARVFERDDQLKAWSDRRVREEALLRAVRRRLPRPVGERVSIADGDGTTLELCVTTGAIASVVRQHGPELVAALQRDGWEFSGIRLRVQPRSAGWTERKVVPRQWDSSSTRPLRTLASALEDGPLKRALARLLKGR
jgi:hypothetical protein